MTTHTNHPARSHAFLSRLHDGELSPAERAQFEAHRAHCKDCRDAAADFERALSLFRSSRSSPPPADLAMRVLRKVQTHARSRWTPFGDLFTVDLRWAGAFAAALLLLLVAAPIVLQQQRKATPSADEPIAVDLRSRALPPEDKAAGAPYSAGKVETPASRNAPARARALPADDLEREKTAVKQDEDRTSRLDEGLVVKDASREEKPAKNKEESAAANKLAFAERAQAPAPAPPPAPASENLLRSPVSSAARQAAAAPSAQRAAAHEAQGGEGGRDQVSISGALTIDRPARLVVEPLDSLGSPPQLETQSQDPDLNDLRGRSFIVMVDAHGRVIDAQETISKKLSSAENKRRDPALAKDQDDKQKDKTAEVSSVLKTLRFKPSERPRRLLVRVD